MVAVQLLKKTRIQLMGADGPLRGFLQHPVGAGVYRKGLIGLFVEEIVFGPNGEKTKPAYEHAKRCLELTLNQPEAMVGFDFAYGFMIMARALALTGQENEGKEYVSKMVEATGANKNERDRQIFLGDLQIGNWYGLTEVVSTSLIDLSASWGLAGNKF